MRNLPMPIIGLDRRSKSLRMRILNLLKMDVLSSLEYVFLILYTPNFSDLWKISYRFFLTHIFHSLFDQIILFSLPNTLFQNCQTQVIPIFKSLQSHSNFSRRINFCVLPVLNNSWLMIITWLVMNLRRRWWISRYFWCHFLGVWPGPWWSIFLLIFFSRFCPIRSRCFALFP